MADLAAGEKMSIYLLLWIQYTNMTDGQTNGRTWHHMHDGTGRYAA